MLILCCDFLFLVVISIATIVVVVSTATIFVVFFSLIFLQNGRFRLSQECDVIIRNFKNLKYQNILTFTVCLIVQITSLICQNCQLSRSAANNSKWPFCQFWSNITYSPDIPVNDPIESRSLRKNGTVPSNRIYKMHEITFIHALSTHCRIYMESQYTTIAFQILSLICTFEDMT